MAWDMHLLQTRKYKKKNIYFSFLFYKAIGISQYLQQMGKNHNYTCMLINKSILLLNKKSKKLLTFNLLLI
jgi:hypothetical protein